MKKIYIWSILTLIITTFLPTTLLAQENASAYDAGSAVAQHETHVTPAQALNVGYTFMRTGDGSKGNGTKSGSVSKQAMQLIYTGQAYDSLTGTTTDCYYVFALQPKGFVIVAADDRVEPILGYSYDNDFVVANMPAHVCGWLGNYERQIEAVAKSDLQAEPATQTKWERLKSGQVMSRAKSGGNSVGPLLTTQWGQNWPWNDKCPVDENGDRCAVGCVAVALGQIMKYHSYPQKGHGYIHYTQEGIPDTISAIFDTTYYDWQNMPNSYVSSGYEPMAQLLADIGKSLFMYYSPAASSTFEDIQTLADVFNYDYFSMQTVGRSSVEDSSWISLIKNELNNNRPVYYRGQNHEDSWIATAHAFVCDGYDANGMFHFNFGWEGSSDGYYNLSNISAGIWGGYNYNQSILIGIQPSTGNTLSENDTLSGSLSYNESLYCGAFSNITILPGTELKFAPGKGMAVSGSILANGTETEPIMITASDTNSGWGGMQIHPSRICYKMAEEPDTLRLNHTTISYSINDGIDMGWPNYFLYPATFDNVVHDGIILDHVVIEHNKGNGIGGRGKEVQNVDCVLLTMDSCEVANNGGTGIDLYYGVINITNSLFHHNKGAISFFTYDSEPSTVMDCKFFNNDFGVPKSTHLHIVVLFDGLFKNNVVFNNSPSDGNIVDRMLIVGNVLTDNIIHDNMCDISVMAISGNSGTITNNVFFNNSGFTIGLSRDITNNLMYNNGGGIRNSKNINNNTIVNNNKGVVASLSDYESINLNNNIIWNNGINLEINDYLLTARNNIITGGSQTFNASNPNNQIDNTSDKNPNFINPTTFVGPGIIPDNVSYELALSSPAIDFGVYDTSMTLPATDLAGNPRINRTLDIGAYENQSDTVHPCFFTENNTMKSCIGLSVDMSMPYRGEQCSFAWYHNDNLIPNSNSDTLHIETVASNDEGDYICVISNAFGIDTSSIIHLVLSPQSPGCIEAINGPDTIYHFQQNIPFSINNVLNADNIEWTVSEGLSFVKTSDTSILVSVNQAIDSAFLYVVASNGCGACADTVMIHLTILPTPPFLHLSGINLFRTSFYYSSPEYIISDNSFVYDDVEWNVPSWITTLNYETGELIIVETFNYDGYSDTIYARWFIEGYGYGEWTPFPIRIFHPNDYGDIIYVSMQTCGNNMGTSWNNAADIQTALYIASCLNKTIWISQGTYYGDGVSENAFVIPDGVQIFGGFAGDESENYDLSLRDFSAHPTVLDGQHVQRTVFHDWTWGSNSILDGFTIQNGYNHTGGNIYGGEPKLQVTNCIIQGGYATWGAGGVAYSTVRNSLIINNTVSGFGSSMWESSASNCIISNNNGLHTTAGSILTNCILWGNNGDPESGCSITYSSIQGEYIDGEGNILLAHSNDGTSPDSNYVRFVDPENGDFRLFYGSACINAGTPDISALGLPSVDLQGLPRVLDGRIDMGAYEYYPVPVVETYDTVCEGNSVTFYGTEYATEGTYRVHANPDPMQDTMYVLHLTVYPADSADFAETACGSYEWNGETFTTSGDYTRTFTNMNGCDSVVTLHLTILFATSAQFADTACGSYEWNGEIYTSSGDFEQTFTAANGCDSVVTLHLTVNQPTTGTDVQTACGSYTWIDGITYTESNNTATYTLTNAVGCDSVVTLNLTIFPADSAEFAETACDSFEWNGETFTSSGNYTRTLTNASGCDSVVTLHLTIQFATSAQFADTACGSYQWNGTTYTVSGDYEQTFTAANGCDSVVTLHLTVNQPSTGTDVQTACGSYTWINGITYTESNNTATYTLTNAVGCDSVVTLNLTIFPADSTEFAETACDSFEWNGETFTSSGNYTRTLTNASGCDSVVTLHLTIQFATSAQFADTTCGSYEWNGQTYSSSGDYEQTFTAANGCDSVVTLHLTINQPTTGTDVQTACGSYTWIDGITYTESNNTATYTLTNAVGCDSVVTLNLTIFPADSVDFAETACGSYEWNGETFTSSGDYTRTLTNVSGCDSVVTLHLTLQFATSAQFADTTCGSYEWNGQNYTSSGDYEQTFTAANGCDSVVTLHLTINQPTTGTDVQTACGSYTWIDGITYTESNNTATYTLTNAVGCDSVVTLNLTIFPADSAEFAETACDSFEWNGETFTSSGNYTRTLTNASGCDSVVTLHLTIQFATSAQFADTACGSYEWNGQTYSSSGDYEQTFTAANGCDSVVTLHLTVNQPTTGTDVQTACGSYTWIDGITYTESNNTATYTLTNAVGCDSVVTLNLTIFPADSADFAETACGSYEWNGETFTTSGDYTRTLTNMNGCDSVVTLHLTIQFATSAQFADTACGSYEWNGQNYTSSGDYEQTFTAANGCDSIVTLHLTVNQPTTGTDVQTACGSYTWIDGITYTESNNTATYTLTNAIGCDSIVTLNLTIFPADSTDFAETACDSFEWNGETFTSSGDYTRTLTNASGCDSVVTLHLTIQFATSAQFADTACGSYEWNGITYTVSGDYEQTFTAANGCDSVVTLHLTINQPTTGTDVQTACGSYTWIDGITYTESNNTATYTLTNAVGCDSVVTLNLTIFPADSADFAETACGSYEWNGETFTTSGDYTRTLTNMNGCDSVVTLHLTIHFATSAQFADTTCGSYEWNGQNYTSSGDYEQTFTAANGCDSVVTLHLTVNQPNTATDVQAACGSFTWIDGITYTESNSTATYTLTNAAGCDSIVTLNLTIFPADSADFAESACDSFEWNGETFTSSGDYTRTLTNASGCDSVVTLHLTIQFATSAQFADTACGSYEWNGQTYSSSGDYEQTFTAANGCDSVVTLHLTVNQPSTGTDVQTACGSYTWIDGITYTESNSTATHTLTNAIGCDSIVTLNLTIFPADSAEFAETACGSYEWNGETFTTSGDYTRTLTNMNGCDSVVTLHLTIQFATSAQFADTACGSYEWNGQTYTSSGDYEQTFTAANGCDSVVTLHLTITVGIDDHNDFAFNLYPNPTHGMVNIQCTMNNVQVETVEFLVFDAYGKLVAVVGTRCTSSLQTAQIDLSGFTAGVYFVKAVADGNVVAVRKVVKR